MITPIEEQLERRLAHDIAIEHRMTRLMYATLRRISHSSDRAAPLAGRVARRVQRRLGFVDRKLGEARL